jgi:WD40 repeat protein
MVAYGDDNKVQMRTMCIKDGTVVMGNEELVTQFNSTVRNVKYDSKYIAASAEDKFCHVMDLGTNAVRKFPKGGHESVIKNFAIDPLHEYIATIGCDGTLIVSAFKDDAIVSKVTKVGKNT